VSFFMDDIISLDEMESDSPHSTHAPHDHDSLTCSCGSYRPPECPQLLIHKVITKSDPLLEEDMCDDEIYTDTDL
jgi:hypothetical protein